MGYEPQSPLVSFPLMLPFLIIEYMRYFPVLFSEDCVVIIDSWNDHDAVPSGCTRVCQQCMQKPSVPSMTWVISVSASVVPKPKIMTNKKPKSIQSLLSKFNILIQFSKILRMTSSLCLGESTRGHLLYVVSKIVTNCKPWSLQYNNARIRRCALFEF